MVEKVDGAVINPFGFNFILDKNMAGIIDNAVKEENEKEASKKPIPKSGEAVMCEQSFPNGTKVKLGLPAEYPEEMTKAICRAVKSNKNVHALYLLLMIIDKEQSYLIVADFEGDKDSIFGIYRISLAGNTVFFFFIPFCGNNRRESKRRRCSRCRSQSIYAYISEFTASSGNKILMKLVSAGINKSKSCRNKKPYSWLFRFY